MNQYITYLQKFMLVIICAMIITVNPATARNIGTKISVNGQLITNVDIHERTKITLLLRHLKATNKNFRDNEKNSERFLIDDILKVQLLEDKVNYDDKKQQAVINQLSQQYKVDFKKYLKNGYLDKQVTTTFLKATYFWKQWVDNSTSRDMFAKSHYLRKSLDNSVDSFKNGLFSIYEIGQPFNKYNKRRVMATMTNVYQQLIQHQIKLPEAVAKYSTIPSAAAGGEVGILSKQLIHEIYNFPLKTIKVNRILKPTVIDGTIRIVIIAFNKTAKSNDKYRFTQVLFTPQSAQKLGMDLNTLVNNKYSSMLTCEDASDAALSSLSPMKADTGFMSLERLSPQFKNIVQPLKKIGDKTQPLKTQNGVLVIMLCGVKHGKTDMKQYNQQLRYILQNKVYSMTMHEKEQRLLEDLRKSAIIQHFN